MPSADSSMGPTRQEFTSRSRMFLAVLRAVENIQPRSKTSGERAFGWFVGENLGRMVSVQRGELANSHAHGSPAQRITRFGERKQAASKSGGLPMIILEQAAQPFAADHFSGLQAGLWPWLQDLMVQPLMRAFPVIMDHVFGHRLTQRGLAEQDDS